MTTAVVLSSVAAVGGVSSFFGVMAVMRGNRTANGIADLESRDSARAEAMNLAEVRSDRIKELEQRVKQLDERYHNDTRLLEDKMRRMQQEVDEAKNAVFVTTTQMQRVLHDLLVMLEQDPPRIEEARSALRETLRGRSA